MKRMNAVVARCALALTFTLSTPLLAQAPRPAEIPEAAVATAISELVTANHILYDQGVFADGYGHVSVRNPANPQRFFMARSVAPGIITAADIMEFDLEGAPIDARGRAAYLERFIHSEIYKKRQDVNAVMHSHSRGILPFGVSQVPLRPIFHNASFIGLGVPVFEIRKYAGTGTDLLVNNNRLGKALADTLGDKAALVLMRGHGNAVVAPRLRVLVGRAIYTEENARLQLQAMSLGKVNYLAPGEVEKMESLVGNSGQDRIWDMWKAKAEQNPTIRKP